MLHLLSILPFTGLRRSILALNQRAALRLPNQLASVNHEVRKMNSGTVPSFGAPRLNFTKSADEIRIGAAALERDYEAKLEALLASAQGSSSFAATFGRLADADGHAALLSAELTLPALVSGDAAVRTASSEAKKQLQKMWARTYGRQDLYNVLVASSCKAVDAEDRRLAEVVLWKFRQAGAALPDADARARLTALDARCAALASDIEQNINEDCTTVELPEALLEGCGEDFVKSLPLSDGLRLCSVKAPVLIPIMRRAVSGEARRRMQEASQRRCPQNDSHLAELLKLRHEAALELNFSCHAERMLAPKMAGSLETARSFCLEMLARIAVLRDAELQKLSARKRSDNGRKRKQLESTEQEGEEMLKVWDVQFYGDMLKREDLDLDDEKLKEFFPLEGTIEAMLSVYAELLGLTFERSKALPTWHEDVIAFEVRESQQVVGHLYLDQFPREGKFGHQMIVPLSPAFVDAGERCLPSCVNISNLPRPQGDKPALLRFSDMQTLFHELGHAMHCLCTVTRYSMLSWAWPMVPWPGGVEQDFLEVPSMALEKFACEPELLSRVSRHYSGKADAPQLDSETIQRMKANDRWLAGTHESRYFAMALFDILCHSQSPPYSFEGQDGLSVHELFMRVLEKYTTLPQIPGTHFCTSWYHLVIGYDAGFYGYGWSDVYAADVFEQMAHSSDGLLGATTGHRLRSFILGPCATRSGSEMLRAFLGRDPTAEAWCRRKGIKA